MSALQASKNRLDVNLEAQNRRIAGLQSQMRDLNSQVTDAQNILNQAGKLDKSIDPLSNKVRTLQRQLLDLKQKLDGLKAALEEKKDETVFLNRKTRKLALDKKGRDEMMTLLAETLGDIQGQVTEIESKRHKLVGYR
jgi:chromosome segregation ATPase